MRIPVSVSVKEGISFARSRGCRPALSFFSDIFFPFFLQLVLFPSATRASTINRSLTHHTSCRIRIDEVDPLHFTRLYRYCNVCYTRGRKQ